MKAPKILLAGLLALSTAGAAQAQTIIHITGSTAFRSAVHTAITHIMTNFTYGYSGASFTGASQAIFHGTVLTTNGTQIGPVYIKTSWSGSLAGIETVSQAFPSTVSTFLTNTTPMSTGGTSGAAANYDPAVQPEVCMNDGFQYDSQYPLPALTETSVGVVSFTFVKNAEGLANAHAAAGLTNMTPLLAQALWENGFLPLSMWTGNTNDVNTLVYAIGRDPDSGTRKTAFLETGIQTFVSAPPVYATVIQYAPTNSSGQLVGPNAGPITSQGFWPAETIDNISFPEADGGYSSGGQLATALSATSPYIYVGYLGLSDDATLTGNVGTGANLSYNGVPYSHAAAENGQYTYWTYEFLGYLPSYISTIANAQTVADTLASQIANENLSGVGESLTSMTVSRQQEGGIVTP
jgi:hypothetical protein